MASNDDDRRSLTDAAGHAALFPARATARVWRGGLEAAADEVLSAPEITRVLYRALAGSLPEELARSTSATASSNVSPLSSPPVASWSGL